MSYKDPARQREYQRQWMTDRRLRGIAILGGRCCQCGSYEKLQVDHIDPNTKNPALRALHTGAFWSWSWHRIERELAKCQVLCHSCHRLKSIREVARGEAKILTAKLTERDVRDIRISTVRPYRILAEQYGVDASLIGLVIRRRIWKHVVLYLEDSPSLA
jgi:5-methylcytosine-specific restriction endonuclease McrA